MTVGRLKGSFKVTAVAAPTATTDANIKPVLTATPSSTKPAATIATLEASSAPAGALSSDTAIASTQSALPATTASAKELTTTSQINWPLAAVIAAIAVVGMPILGMVWTRRARRGK